MKRARKKPGSRSECWSDRPENTDWPKMRSIWTGFVLCLAMVTGTSARAQALTTVRFDEASRTFRIDAADMSYVLGINAEKRVQALYWGKRLGAGDHFPAAKQMPEVASHDLAFTVTPQEFVGWGAGLYVEPNLKISFPDGNRDLALQYMSHNIAGSTLRLLMKDVSREVYVTLEYVPDAETGILRRSAEIENRTPTPLLIEQVSAATWNLPRGTDYRLRYLTGRWAGEWTVQERAVQPGKTILESRRGTTGAQNSPWFAIDHTGNAGQETGSVWFGALAWSGSWQLRWSRTSCSRCGSREGQTASISGTVWERVKPIRRRHFMGATLITASAAHPGCCIVSRMIRYCHTRHMRLFGQCFTTLGKLRSSAWMKRDSWL